MTATPRILLIGYGNPGRRDDGLGPAAAAALESRRLPGVTVDSNYQLSVEDAARVAEHDAVVFIDADARGPAPFSFGRIEPGDVSSFSTHSVRAEGVLALAASLFGAQVAGYVLGIRGYVFNDFGEGLSDGARTNLAAALRFIEPILRRGVLADGLATTSDPTASTADAPAATHCHEDGSCKTEST